MRFLILALFCFLPVYSADTIDLSSLSPEKVSAIKQIVDPPSTSKVVREEVTQWGKLGKDLGEAMVAAAKELGVAAVDFAKTPLGILIVSIIVLKLIGTSLFGILLGLIIIAFGWLYLRYVNRTFCQSYTYEVRPTLFGLYNKRYVVKTTLNDEVMDAGRGNISTADMALLINISANCLGFFVIAVSISHF